MRDLTKMSETEITALILLLGPFEDDYVNRWAHGRDWDRVKEYFTNNAAQYCLSKFNLRDGFGVREGLPKSASDDEASDYKTAVFFSRFREPRD